MSELLAMSFDCETSPSIEMKAVGQRDTPTQGPCGWGFAWYPPHGDAAVVIKDPTSIGENAMTQVLRDWNRFRSTLFICHIRGAAKRITQQDTHPFCRSYAGRDWVLAHNGDLVGDLTRELPLGDVPMFEPVGRTDSERLLCWLLTRAHAQRARGLADLGWSTLHEWLATLNHLGTANLLLSDGHDLVVYRDAGGFNALSWIRRRPPHTLTRLEADKIALDLSYPFDLNRTMVLFSTTPLSPEPWTAMAPGQLLVARNGAILWDSHAQAPAAAPVARPGTSDAQEEAPTRPAPEVSGQSGTTPAAMGNADVQGGSAPGAPGAPGAPTATASAPGPEAAAQSLPPGGALPGPAISIPGAISGAADRPPDGHRAASHSQAQEGRPLAARHRRPASELDRRPYRRVLAITHETVYRYESSVERSSHMLRLKPVHDTHQELLDFSLQITPDCLRQDFEDVFGNQSALVDIDAPYREMHVRSEAVVRLTGTEALDANAPKRRYTIPLVWMPWQRQMMTPFLLPLELPESQLRELSDFAMSFVERQDYDLVETLFDMNESIGHDFTYLTGSTGFETTPYEVYVNRRGVCQDFANLLICLARLLNIPARYRVGYIFTGSTYENKAQSEASHAWVELFLPWLGWRGFDPTNARLAGKDHIRVACGRNYRDATPTSGTIYKGGGRETLSVAVRTRVLEEDKP